MGERSHNPPAVLVVDDTRVNRIVLEKKLTENGYRVTSAEDGKQALELLPSEKEDLTSDETDGDEFDAVILDIMMPVIDGIEVLSELRKVRSSIELPVIMATAKNQSEDIVGALAAGANDYVTKPIDLPALLARLETQIALRRSHEALKKAQRSLINAAKMETIGLLAAGVAHEIRNPLAQIQMAADGIGGLKATKEDETARTLCGLMNDAILKADLIVRRLMEFSGSAKLDLKERDLNPLIEETLDILADEISKNGVTLDLKLDPALKKAYVASGEMEQVLINIIMNALQAMPNGGELTVRTAQRILEGLPPEEGSRSGNRPRNGDEVCAVDIEDTGSGIAPEHLGSLFDAFFTTKPTGSGTGLGLTVAKKMIDLHEGILEVGNRDDREGTSVTISLPCAEVFKTTV